MELEQYQIVLFSFLLQVMLLVENVVENVAPAYSHLSLDAEWMVAWTVPDLQQVKCWDISALPILQQVKCRDSPAPPDPPGPGSLKRRFLF